MERRENDQNKQKNSIYEKYIL